MNCRATPALRQIVIDSHRCGQQQRFVRIGERHPAIPDRAVGALDSHRPTACRGAAARAAPGIRTCRAGAHPRRSTSPVSASAQTLPRVCPGRSMLTQSPSHSMVGCFVVPQPVLEDVRLPTRLALATGPGETRSPAASPAERSPGAPPRTAPDRRTRARLPAPPAGRWLPGVVRITTGSGAGVSVSAPAAHSTRISYRRFLGRPVERKSRAIGRTRTRTSASTCRARE